MPKRLRTKEIKLYFQNMRTILGSIVNKIEKDLYDHVNNTKSIFTLTMKKDSYDGPVHMGSQVPTHTSKSQHGGQVRTLEPQETIEI